MVTTGENNNSPFFIQNTLSLGMGLKRYQTMKEIEFSQDIADAICEKTATTSFSMPTIIDSIPNCPRLSTIYKWLRTNEDFAKDYARAKQDQAEFLAEELISISDDGSNDLMTIVKGDQTYTQENKEVTNRSRLRVDTRKWIIAKLKPNKYGDKIDVTSAGEKIQTELIITGKKYADKA